MRNTRSAYRYEPNTTSAQMATAAIGMITYRLTPSSSKAAPMPANSDTTRPVLASSTQNSATPVSRRLNCSRISAARPLPVCVPSRIAISWTSTRAKVTSTMKNSVR